MTKNEFRRKLVRLGVVVETSRGKGGHVLVRLGERLSVMPTGSGEIPIGTMRAILKDLGLRLQDLR